MSSKRRFLALCASLPAIVVASSAHAESGELNLHIDVALGPGVIGPLAPPGSDGTSRLVLAGWVGLDYKVSDPYALEALIGIGNQFEMSSELGRVDEIFYGLAIGVRIRPFDDTAGYLDDPGGNTEGNFWVSAHVGYHHFDDVQPGIDVGTGYELSMFYPVQLGVFARFWLLGGGQRNGIDGLAVIGLNGSIDLSGRPEPVDSDDDGLTDDIEEREHTRPERPDTDLDSIPDGIEVRTGTNPRDNDSDDDGLDDGREDRNRNGRLDDGETNPRERDTDGGGIPDGDEVFDTRLNPRDPADDDRDRDGVNDTRDQCADTAEGTTVDENGCARMEARMELTGVLFDTGSADILPASEPALRRALQVLVDNPDALIEIAGHTDSVGNAGANMRLSRRRAQAVRQWLIEQGVAGYRITARGYGADEPLQPNDTDAGRQANRRIEIRARGE